MEAEVSEISVGSARIMPLALLLKPSASLIAVLQLTPRGYLSSRNSDEKTWPPRVFIEMRRRRSICCDPISLLFIGNNLMQISVFGIDYVGVVSAACLANGDHTVIAVDQNSQKVEPLGAYISPIIEPSLERLIREGIRNKRLRATNDIHGSVQSSDPSFVCATTLSHPNGALDTNYSTAVAEEIDGVILK